MPRKKKFNKVKHVKAIARANAGQLPAKQVIKSKKEKEPKYKERFDPSDINWMEEQCESSTDD